MEQNQIQSRFETFVQDIRSRIEKDPVQSFFVGVLIGAIIVVFRGLLVPLVIILAIVAGALYYFGNSKGSQSSSNPPANPGPGPSPTSDRDPLM